MLMSRFAVLGVVLFVGGCDSTIGPATRLNGSDAGKANDNAASVVNVETATHNQREPTQTSTIQDVKPTQEQLARWARAPFEPLQLLACREWEKTGFVTCMAHTPDGRQFILAGSKLAIWSLVGDEPEHTMLDLIDLNKNQSFRALAVSPDGKWFAAGDSEGTIRIWNLSDRKELISKELYSNDITQIAISPDSTEIATTTYADEVTIWNATTLEQKNRFKVETNSLKRILYMSQNLLAASGETTTSWDVSTGKLVQTLSPGRYNNVLAKSPDGKRFVFGDNEGLRLWDVDGSKIEGTLLGGFATNELVEFSPDGKHLVTANGAKLRLWDIESKQVVQVIDVAGPAIVGLGCLPETRLLLVASEDGRTRIWGTPSSGEPLGLQPMHVEVAMPESTSREPATPTQLLQVIDLRTFPRLPGGVPKLDEETMIEYTAPVNQDEAKLFYRYYLGQQGWVELPGNVNTPDYFGFRKNGFMLWASIRKTGDSETNINLVNSGNFDPRWAPRFDAAPVEVDYESDSTVHYRTKADLIDIETTLLRKMHEAGWTPYSRLNSSHSETPDARDMEFLHNSSVLRVSIGKFPDDPSSYHIQYSMFPMTNSIPIPPDSGFIEFDGSSEPNLVATTTMNLEQTRDFYDKELIAQGWLTREIGRSVKDEYNWLPYIRGQQDLTIGLESRADGRTLVRVGEGLEDSSWQLAKPQSTAEPATAAVGIEATDFPILNQSKSAEFDANDKSLNFQMDATPLLKVADQYTKELESKGWTTDVGVKADDYVFLTFTKTGVEIALRARLKDGNAIVNIQGDGLLWTKPLPGGTQVISYETWLRLHHHPASLDLLDEYHAEMKSIATEKK